MSNTMASSSNRIMMKQSPKSSSVDAIIQRTEQLACSMNRFRREMKSGGTAGIIAESSFSPLDIYEQLVASRKQDHQGNQTKLNSTNTDVIAEETRNDDHNDDDDDNHELINKSASSNDRSIREETKREAAVSSHQSNNKNDNNNKIVEQQKKAKAVDPPAQQNGAVINDSGCQIKVVYHQFGPSANEVLEIELWDNNIAVVPEQPDHVVVKVQASTVTLQDCLTRRGFDFDIMNPISVPVTPGFDIVGNIVTIASRETVDTYGLIEGDRVAALVRTGGNARYISVPASSLVKIPRHLNSADVVAMVSVYTAAYQAMKAITQEKGKAFSLLNKKVLIVMSHKGRMDDIGQAIILMCHKARATIYATAPSNQRNYVKNVLGAIPLPEKKDKWISFVEEEMDYVFDGVCEDGLETPYRALKSKINGEIICYGHSSMLQQQGMGFLGVPTRARLNKLWGQLTIPCAKFVDIWESFQEDPTTYKNNLISLCDLLSRKKIQPRIALTISLDEVAWAQTKLESSSELINRGIVVCKPWKRIVLSSDNGQDEIFETSYDDTQTDDEDDEDDSNNKQL